MLPQLRWKEPPCRLRRQDGHRPPAGIPEGVTAVVEGGEGDLPAIPVDTQGQAPARHPLPCRRPENDAQQKVGREGRDEQHPQVHPGVENAPLHRHPVGEHPQRQHAARHAAGEGEEQQRQSRRQAEGPVQQGSEPPPPAAQGPEEVIEQRQPQPQQDGLAEEQQLR